jgi:hypothetical protein
MDRAHPSDPRENAPPTERDRPAGDRREHDHENEPNPPRTTTGPVTAPKFGSAGSGGAELEPGPPKP